MGIDSYTLCPGGCGKKIRFCCGKDVVADFNKILTALEGEQRLTALDKANAAIEKHGEKPCLLALKVNLLFELGELEKSVETLDIFRKNHPTNPVGLALHTISLLAGNDTSKLDKAVEQLQRAIEHSGENDFSGALFEGLRRVGLTLFSVGKLTAARAHLTLYNQFLEEPNSEISNFVLQTVSDPRIPLLLRQDYPLVECDEEKPWKEKFNQVIAAANYGTWLKSIEELTDLDKNHPNEPLIAKSIAILESRLGNASEMAAAWSQYADTDGVPIEAAVEAEALSQLIDPTIEESGYDIVSSEFSVKEMEGLLAQFASSGQFNLIESRQQLSPDTPPPKAIYLFLDKPIPDTGVGIKEEDIPLVCSQILVFGKEMDRDARIEVVAAKDDAFEANQKSLLQLLGDFIDSKPQSEEVLEQIPRLEHQLSWNWRFPDDTPPEHREALIDQKRSGIILTKWPDLELEELDGVTPREAAKKDYLKIPVLGAILVLEIAESTARREFFDCNPLRETLGLPKREMIDPSTIENIEELTLAQIDKVEVEKLTDENLLEIFNFAGLCSSTIALHRTAIEITKRKFSPEKISLPHVYAILARLEKNSETAFEHIKTARALTIEAGESPGLMMVAELELRLERGQVDECPRLMKEIELRHMREEGVSNELMRVLMKFGIIGPDGKPRGRANPSGQSELVGAGATEESGKIWTPDGEQGGGQSESKLWVPD